jgi:hypothetical protein
MHEGTIVYASKGETVSEPFIRILLEKNPSCFGCAIIKNGEILTAIDPNKVTKENFEASVSSVVEVLNDHKDKDRITYFGNHPDGALKDDLQPFTILQNAKQEVVVVACLEGKFPQYTEANSSHSDAYLCAFKHLLPTLYDRYANKNENLAEFAKGLDDLHFRLTIENMIGERGNITLFIANGDILSYKRPNDTEHRTYPWGWASHHHGYKESEFPLKAAPTEAGKKVFGKPQRKVTEPAAITYTHEDTTGKSSVSQVALAAASSGVANGPIYVKVPPNYTVKHKSQVKAHFKKFTGVVRPDWRDLPICEVTAPTYVKNPDLIPKELIVPAPAGAVASEKAAVTNAATGTKTTQTVAETKGPVVVTDSTIINPDELVKVQQFLSRKDIKALIEQRRLTIKAQGSAEMLIDPKEIQASEKKNPTFSEQAGIDIMDTASWTVNQLYSLGQEGLFSLAVLAANWKAKALLLQHANQTSKKAEPTAVAEPPKRKVFGQR